MLPFFDCMQHVAAAVALPATAAEFMLPHVLTEDLCMIPSLATWYPRVHLRMLPAS